MDVVIVPEARLDIRALFALGPAPGTWGMLLGRKAGSRFYVEKVFPAPLTAAPSAEAVDGLDAVWEGRTIGLFAVRPGRDIRRAVMGPRFYGKVFLDIRPRKNGPEVRAYAVRHDRDFFLSPLPLGAGAKRGDP